MTNQWNGSSVMENFAKIAKEQGFLSSKLKDDKDVVGNSKTPTPVKDHRRYEPTEEYDVTDHKCIMEDAHPEKKKELAEAQGEGGVVENNMEQQEADIKAATNMPSGALVGIHAALINELVKLANEYEENGNTKAALRIDETIRSLSNRPFDGGLLVKEAFWPALLGLVGSIVGPAALDWLINKTTTDKFGRPTYVEKTDSSGKISRVPRGNTLRNVGLAAGAVGAAVSVAYAFGDKLMSRKEDLATDVQDLYNTLQKVSSESPSAKNALMALYPFAASVKTMNISTQSGFQKFVTEYDKFKSTTYPQVKLDASKSAQVELKEKWYWPFSDVNKIKSQLSDVEADFKDMDDIIKNLNASAAKIGEGIKQDIKQEPELKIDPGIKGLQQILSLHGFMDKKWEVPVDGTLDEQTITATKELEELLDANLDAFRKAHDIKFNAIGSIIQNDQLKIDPVTLLKLIDLAELQLKKE